MARKITPWLVGAVVGAWLLNAESKQPGVAADTSGTLRGVVAPVASDVIGAAGDAVLIARDELERQGVDPGAVLQDPQVATDTGEAEGITGG